MIRITIQKWMQKRLRSFLFVFLFSLLAFMICILFVQSLGVENFWPNFSLGLLTNVISSVIYAVITVYLLERLLPKAVIEQLIIREENRGIKVVALMDQINNLLAESYEGIGKHGYYLDLQRRRSLTFDEQKEYQTLIDQNNNLTERLDNKFIRLMEELSKIMPGLKFNEKDYQREKERWLLFQNAKLIFVSLKQPRLFRFQNEHVYRSTDRHMLETFMAQAKDYPEMNYYVGVMYSHLEKFALAITAFEKVINDSISFDHYRKLEAEGNIYIFLGRQYLNLNRYEEAVNYYDLAFQKGVDRDNLLAMKEFGGAILGHITDLLNNNQEINKDAIVPLLNIAENNFRLWLNQYPGDSIVIEMLKQITILIKKILGE